MNVKIGNKAKKILAGVTLTSILLTSMPVNAFASGNNVDMTRAPSTEASTPKPEYTYKWKKYSTNETYDKEYVGEGYETVYPGSAICGTQNSYKIEKNGFKSWRDPNKPDEVHYDNGRSSGIYRYEYVFGDSLTSNNQLYRTSPDWSVSGKHCAETIPPTKYMLFKDKMKHKEVTIDNCYYNTRAKTYMECTKEYGDIYKHITKYSKGNYISEVTSYSEYDYPLNGEKEKYWYEYVGKEKNTTEADEFTPQLKEIKIGWGKTVTITDPITNLPQGASITDITNPAINTKQSGKQNAKFKITFSDKSTKEVVVPVIIEKSEAENYNPTVAPAEVTKGKDIKLEDAITNLPEGTTVKVVQPVDNSKPGNQTGKVEITFKDSSIKVVDVPVTVKELESVTYTDQPKSITGIDTKPSVDEIKKHLPNLPEGADIVINESVESGNFEPKVKQLEVKRGQPVNLADALLNKPANAKIITSAGVDTSKAGLKSGTIGIIVPGPEGNIKVTINFKDGSSKQVQVPIKYDDFKTEQSISVNVLPLSSDTYEQSGTLEVEDKPTEEQIREALGIKPEDSVTIKDFSDRTSYDPAIKELNVKRKDKVDLRDAVTNKKDGVDIKIVKPVDTSTKGTKVGELGIVLPEENTKISVTIKFKDGSTKDVELPLKYIKKEVKYSVNVNVKALSGDEFTPEFNRVDVKWGKPVDITGSVKNLPSDAKLEDITKPIIDTKTSGSKIAKGKITFADGSTKEIEIPIVVLPSQAELDTSITVDNAETTVGTKLDLTKFVRNLPEGSIAKDITESGYENKLGTTEGQVKVIFADGSEKIYKVPIKINNIVCENPQPLKDEIQRLTTELEKIKKEKIELEAKLKAAEKTATDTNSDKEKVQKELNETKTNLDNANQKITDLEKKIKTAEENLQKEKDINTKASERITQLENDIKAKDSTITTKDSKIKELEGLLEKEKTAKQQADAKIAELNKQIGDLNTKITEKDAKISELESELAKQKEINNTDKATITRLEKELAEEKTKLAKSEEEKASLQEQLNTANKNVENLTKQVEDLTQKLNKASQDLEDEKTNHKALQERFDAQKAQLDEANNTISELEGKLNALDAENKKLKGQINDLNAQIETLTKKVSELEGQIQEKDKNIGNLNTRVEELEKDNQNKQSTIDQLNSEKESLNTELQEANNKVATKTTELEKANKALEAANTELENTKGTLESTKSELESTKSELETTKSALEETKHELEASQGGNETLEAKVRELEAKVSELEGKITALQGEKDALTSEKESLEAQVNTLQSEKEELNHELETIKEEKGQLEIKILEKETIIEKLIQEKAAQKEEIDKLNKDIKQLTEDGQKKDNQIKDLTDKYKKQDKNIKDLEQTNKDKDNLISSLKNDIGNLNKRISEEDRTHFKLGSSPYFLGYSARPEYKEPIQLGRRSQATKDMSVFKIGSQKYIEIINGVKIPREMDVEPYISNNRTMLPLRYAAESLGASVSWDNDTRTATFIKDNLKASIQMGSNVMLLNDSVEIEMDTLPEINNDRLFVSLTNLSKVFGKTNGNILDGVQNDIEWDEVNQFVYINK